ncbi:GNAT family N-acetyltransferase [Trinickia fusca]|uniref:GNAT family N-acetyltransferase n=1 Tax=Trinickia fusca TaxID=2419777 RepID=A0A494X4F2_9BURK|nr:GNAT family N-acetyltransferase [Trinickia fusca]
MILRAARQTDAFELADLYLRSRRELVAYAPLAHSDSAVRDWIANILIPSANVTVACDGDVIVGMAAHSRNEADGTMWLDQLYVCPRHMRTGIGTALLEHVKAAAPHDLHLYTFAQNLAATAFYERHGFVALAWRDGSDNEERCPDVHYRWCRAPASAST